MLAGLEGIEGGEPRFVQIQKARRKQEICHRIFGLLGEQLLAAALGSLEFLCLELFVCLLPKIGGHVNAALGGTGTTP